MSTDTARRQLKWAMIALVILAVGIVVASMLSLRIFEAARDRSDERALGLADRIEIACNEGSVDYAGRDICARATEVQQEIKAEGKRGPQGEPGPPGKDGRDSNVPGPRGPSGGDGRDGRDGQDSTVPGPPGADGVDGKDGESIVGPEGPKGEKGDPGESIVGPRGPAGADSTVPGPAGPSGPPGPAGPAGATGPAGADGVSVSTVTCTGTGPDSYWTFTLTDGQTIRATGPCRIGNTTP